MITLDSRHAGGYSWSLLPGGGWTVDVHPAGRAMRLLEDERLEALEAQVVQVGPDGVLSLPASLVVSWLEHSRLLAMRLEEATGTFCRVCGCSEYSACEGGCWWVEGDLCSACADDQG